MGDYGFGVLVQSNTGNKSAFPVRFHPHLQPPHHHQNATPSPAAFINNNTAANGSSAGSAWLFPAPAAHNIQDEILGSEKAKSQQQEQQDPLEKQQLSPSPGQEAGILPDTEKAKSEDNQGDTSSENGNGKEKIRIESPVLTGFDYQEAAGLGASTQPLTSSASSLTGFSNWSAAIAPSSSTIINEDASFFHQGGVPAASANNGALLFQNFPHHVSPGFGGSFSPQIGPLSQHHPHHPHFQHHHSQHQQQRRSPASPHPPPFTHRNAAFNQLPHLANNLNKPPSPWSSYQSPSPTPSSSWSPGGGGYGGWGGSQGRDHRRGLNGGITPLNSISPLKKNFASNHIQLQKYARPSSAFAPKSWMEDSLNRADNIFPFPDRPRTFDMHSLESSLIDIMRAENDSIKDEITASFRRFGPLIVDWPHKAESKSYFPPKGYAFLLFQDESSVQALIDACIEEDGKLYLCVSSPTIKDKPVQIRPWNLSDSDFVMDGSQPLDPRKTIFVGGVPRPLRAVELAMIMDRLYGGVCYAGIDTDPELKYPKGAGRVAFSNQQSYIAAISARFVQLQHGEIDKRVEVKPYVLDDQLCDECQGARCGGKFAPFFCANVTCLQYYCEYCWAAIHSRAGREFHKPLVKEGGDRPRHISFRWN
ncbi:cytoplasmic polyadenylation element-binding protein 4 isoform X5 [Myotis lucifugus]|uniref:cytoplasmic polyadenylation element-binding protein 4 isoform X5 n=1 Tax=Myotis lucifugus TaxID=59463 RepID=UPI000CCC4641|nr:cytoplasmic polyadenylation element-binding protein 4 isoform X5 [Myotis lucifugus]